MNDEFNSKEPVGPQNDQLFVPVSGRYYSAMWSLPFPEFLSPFGMGGDITFQLWREDEKPDVWYLTFRYRYFRDEKAFGSSDVRRWNEWRLASLTETDALAKVNKALIATKLLFRIHDGPDCLVIGGGMKEFVEAIQKKQPHWIHMQIMAKE